MLKRAITAVLLGLVASSPATPTTMFPKKFVCPVGGEKFTADVIGSMTSWGQRPDGRRYGTTPVVPITECPGNGFVLFDEKFDEATARQLTDLVNGADYQGSRKTETPHYRAWWLMDRIGRDPFDSAFMLLVASWETDGDPARKARYQRAFVDAAGKLPWSEAKRSDWFWVNLRAANALRELGDFEAATALLATLDTPDRLPQEPDQLEGARLMIDGLKVLNTERNAAAEPANLIPPQEAAYRCLDGGSKLTAVETKRCDEEGVRKAIQQLKEYRKASN